MSGWGLKFFDYDNDGNLDLFFANGNPDDLIEERSTRRDLSGAVAAVPQRREAVEECQRAERSGLSKAAFGTRAGPRRL